VIDSKSANGAAAAGAYTFSYEHKRITCRCPDGRSTAIHALVPTVVRGIKVYVHGYDVDSAGQAGRNGVEKYLDWAVTKHQLLQQFGPQAAIGYLCLFVAGPTKRQFAVLWPSLEDVWQALSGDYKLLNQQVQLYGHSAAYRTLVNWLKDPKVVSVSLLDGLYGYANVFEEWFTQTLPATDKQRKMALINTHTGSPRIHADQLAKNVMAAGPLVAKWLKNKIDEVPAVDFGTRTRLTVGTVKCSHMQLVTTGKVLPWLMERGF
jgi:hypothetical protein